MRRISDQILIDEDGSMIICGAKAVYDNNNNMSYVYVGDIDDIIVRAIATYFFLRDDFCAKHKNGFIEKSWIMNLEVDINIIESRIIRINYMTFLMEEVERLANIFPKSQDAIKRKYESLKKKINQLKEEQKELENKILSAKPLTQMIHDAFEREVNE